MAGLDDLISQIPIADIASKLGADQGEVASAVQQLVPALVGGLQVNVQDDNIDSSKLEEAVSSHAVSGLLDGGVNVNDVDENEGDQIVSRIFGGNDSASVASALAGGGAAGGGLVQKLLPILAPIVLAYIGKQFANKNAPAGGAQASGGGLGATCWAASSVAPPVAATTRWAASWAACWAAARGAAATRSATFSVDCWAARSRPSHTPDERPPIPGGSGAFASPQRAQ